MLTRYAIALLTSLSFATVGSSTIAQTVTPLPTGRPMSFDLAGVKLGATVAEVKAALLRSGYRVDHVHITSTFEQEVASEAGRRLGKPVPFQPSAGVYSIDGHGPHREEVTVLFMQRAGGAVVSAVTVSIPSDAMTTADVRAQLLAKYGKPDSSRFQGAEFTWCSVEVIPNCGANFVASGHLDTYYPSLKAATYRGGRIVLDIGARAVAQSDKDRADAIERLAPKSRTGAF